MKALLFLKIRSAKNFLISLKEKPQQLIMVLVFVGMFVMVLSTPKPKQIPSSNPAMVEITRLISQNYGLANLGQWIFTMIFFGVILFVGLLTLITSLNRGTAAFKEPDTQFIFCSPLRQQSVLIYGMFNQMGNLLLGSFFFLYQLPNFRQMGIPVSKMLLLLLIWNLSIILATNIAMVLYLLVNDSVRKQRFVIGFLLLIPAIMIAAYMRLFMQSHDFIQAALQFFRQPWIRFFPIAGWATELGLGIISGMKLSSWIALALIVLPIPLLIVLMYRIPSDFYEDALVNIGKQPNAMKSKEQQRHEYVQRVAAKRKIKTPGLRHGSGPSTIFVRQLREAFRLNPSGLSLTLFVTLLMAIPMSLPIIFGGADAADGKIMFTVFTGMICFVSLFLAINSSMIEELSNPYFYMLPGKALTKLIWASLFSLLRTAVDYWPGFILIGIICKVPAMLIICCCLALISLYLATTGAQLLTFRIMGQIKTILSNFILFGLEFVFAFPTGALLFGAFYFFHTGSEAYPLLFLPIVVLNIVIYLGSLTAGINLLNKGPELN